MFGQRIKGPVDVELEMPDSRQTTMSRFITASCTVTSAPAATADRHSSRPMRALVSRRVASGGIAPSWARAYFTISWNTLLNNG